MNKRRECLGEGYRCQCEQTSECERENDFFAHRMMWKKDLLRPRLVKKIRPPAISLFHALRQARSTDAHKASKQTIETHQMRMKEKLALHTAAELRQKARDWLARSVVNRVHEGPEPA